MSKILLILAAMSLSACATVQSKDKMDQYAYQVEKNESSGIVKYRTGMIAAAFEVPPPQFASQLIKSHCPNGHIQKERKSLETANMGLIGANVPWVTVTYKCKG